MDNVDIAIIHRYRAETEFGHHQTPKDANTLIWRRQNKVSAQYGSRDYTQPQLAADTVLVLAALAPALLMGW